MCRERETFLILCIVAEAELAREVNSLDLHFPWKGMGLGGVIGTGVQSTVGKTAADLDQLTM